MSETPEISGAKARLELLATELPNWARQLLDYIDLLENELIEATGEQLAALNRRAAVEQILFDAAAGKRSLPGPEECRALAMKLGVPDELRDPRFDATLRTS